MEPIDNRIDEQESSGILLYYKYTTVPNIESLVLFFESNCKSLNLLGRVRIASNGVNVTIGGKMSALERHIKAMKLNEMFEGTDFKLAACGGPLDERIARECGFTDLSIRVVKELVTLRSGPSLRPPDINNAGKHLTATEFHSVLQDAGNNINSQEQTNKQEVLLLDARNLYETRIGKFQNPDVETLDPKIRQYSDLPAWIDDHSEQLHGKNILMYCTGGIRCEMASAYIRSKGAGYENVFQLYGGIQRYLEQFPDGGFFKGKNFVFDHRVSVGSQDPSVIGMCLQCGISFDDYSSRCRCAYCRMLVLICCSCQGNATAEYVCELCKKHRDGNKTMDKQLHLSDPLETSPRSAVALTDVNISIGKKLRILCLHGFRQNASSFKGRTSSLAKKLKTLAEFVFIDAPRELPFIYHQTADNQQPPPSIDKCRKRYAWLIDSNKNSNQPDWAALSEPFDPLQYQQQIDGFEDSYNFLKDKIQELGSFDGILGFSQGSAMVTLFLEHQQRMCQKISFRFAILCSGFCVSSGNFGKEVIKCPSLHIFGGGRGKDRQIECEASRKLAGLYEDGCSVVVEHDMGHIIPTCSPYIDQIKLFLERFV